MGEEYLNNALVCAVERETFDKVAEDDVMARPCFRNPADSLAFSVFSVFLAAWGFTFYVPAAAAGLGIEDGVDEADYAFAYSFPKDNDDSNKVHVKYLVRNNHLFIDALVSGSSDPVRLKINIDDFAGETDDNKYRSQYKNLGELVDSINKGVLDNIFGSSTASAINAKRILSLVV
ncbi:putative proteasome inhibitor [Bidens hawaiensis]|uniref:putative proteasome inhibitor n=1 Tax=Bidens hawaiensis TaxID=980011 RepID=UPI00404A3FFD